jgi:hypothetical protein
MWPVLVVVQAVDVEHMLEMPAAENQEAVEGSTASSPSEDSKDMIPICLGAVSSGDEDAAAAVEVFRGHLQEERGHARA